MKHFNLGHKMNDIQKAFDLAKQARLNAHAPYSKFLVGAAIKPNNSTTLYTGCNVENASFGGTICAERTAITKMVSEVGSQTLEYVVVVTDSDPLAGPCGMCLQVISEFSDKNTKIHLFNLEGLHKEYSFSEMLPLSFTKDWLPKN